MKGDLIRLFRSGDVLLALLILFTGYWLLGVFSPADTESINALVQIDSSVEYEIDLKKDQTIVLDEFNPSVKIKVESNGLRIIQNDCEQKICIKMGAISEPGQMIVCVPKKILIFVPVGNDKHRIKAITG